MLYAVKTVRFCIKRKSEMLVVGPKYSIIELGVNAVLSLAK